MLAHAIAEFVTVRHMVQECNALLRWRRSPSAVASPNPDPQPEGRGYLDTFLRASFRAWWRFRGAVLCLPDVSLGDFPWTRVSGVQEEDNLPSQQEKWTLFEGFYADMGGFVVVREDGTSETGVLLERIMELEIEHRITPVPLAEIRDKSKGDWVSNLIALVQTAWFVLQCCARVAQHLPLSIVELGTLGYVCRCYYRHPCILDAQAERRSDAHSCPYS